MSVRSISIPKQFTTTSTSEFKNIMVNGCSYTWNNSQSTPVTWPYYLKDLCDIQQIFDCSQAGSGSNHIFTSTISEIETNKNITPQDTLVIIMWSGLARVDLIGKKDKDFVLNKTDPGYSFYLENRYNFFDDWYSLPLFRVHHKITNPSMFDEFRETYHKLIDPEAQILCSATKILSLSEYLKNKGFKFLFLTWEKKIFEAELLKLPSVLRKPVRDKILNIKTLGEYADEYELRIPGDGHPTPDAHLKWTRECFMPALKNLKYITNCQ